MFAFGHWLLSRNCFTVKWLGNNRFSLSSQDEWTKLSPCVIFIQISWFVLFLLVSLKSLEQRIYWFRLQVKSLYFSRYNNDGHDDEWSSTLRGLAKSPFTSNLLLYHVWQTIKEKKNCHLACSSDSWLRGYFLFLSECRPKTLEENWRAVCLGTHLVVKSAVLFKESPTMECPAVRYLFTSPLIQELWHKPHTHRSLSPSHLWASLWIYCPKRDVIHFFTATLQLIPLTTVLQLLWLSRGGGGTGPNGAKQPLHTGWVTNKQDENAKYSDKTHIWDGNTQIYAHVLTRHSEDGGKWTRWWTSCPHRASKKKEEEVLGYSGASHPHRRV